MRVHVSTGAGRLLQQVGEVEQIVTGYEDAGARLVPSRTCVG